MSNNFPSLQVQPNLRILGVGSAGGPSGLGGGPARSAQASYGAPGGFDGNFSHIPNLLFLSKKCKKKIVSLFLFTFK